MIDRVRDWENSMGQGAENLQELGLNYLAAAREQLTSFNDQVKDYVSREPARAVGIALGLGVLVGWLIKRR